MSDILIKNMKLPENCLHCGFSHMASDCLKIWIICKPKDISVTDSDAVKDGRPDWCPLVEVTTPHGRLIDADKLRAEFPHPNDWRNPELAYAHLSGIWATIDCAETIIGAEGNDG